MTPEDAARLTEICFPEGPWTAGEIRSFLDQQTTRYFYRDNGFLLAQFVPPEAEIQLLAVSPDARREGVASSLLEALIAAAVDEGVTEIFLEVCSENPAAIALYATSGFDVVGKRRNYYLRHDWSKADAVLMRKALTQGQQR